MKEIELPEKLYIEDKIGTNGYHCTDYYNYREQVAYTPEIKTRKAERNRIIKLISQMPELGAGVNANHMATVEQVALRDRIIEVITK